MRKKSGRGNECRWKRIWKRERQKRRKKNIWVEDVREKGRERWWKIEGIEVEEESKGER